MSASRLTGFTLIEIMVAIGIFSSIVLITNGIFTQFILTQRRDISEQELQEDVRLAIELLSREIRTAYASTFAITSEGNNAAGPTLVFRDQNGTCIAHRRQGNIWERAERESQSECDQVGFDNFSALTSPATVIENLAFRVPTDVVENGELSRQGFISIILQAKSANTSIPAFALQTSLASRQLKIYGE